MSLTPRRKYSLEATGYWLQLGRVDSEQAEGVGLDWCRISDHSEAVTVVEGGGHLIESAGREVA